MNMIEDCIDKIVQDGDIREMQKLAEILEEAIEILKRYDEKIYKKYEMCLYKMAYGAVLSKEMAEDIVSKMQPYRMRWTFEETENIQDQYGIDNIRSTDFFIVMNSAYNDYKDIFDENIDYYVKFVNDFIHDEDAIEDKVFTYFTTIPN